MKTLKLLIGTLAMVLSFSACQNKSTTSESGDSTIDMSSDSSHNMDAMESKSPIMSAMDQMMRDMHQMEMTGNADYDLISMLKSHHQGAIDMSKAQLESGTEPKLKEIAQRIVDKQSKENDMLDDMLKSADKSKKDYDPAAKQTGLGKDMDENMTKMMEMNHESSGSIDHEFASMMIKHHRDGIDMGKTILKYSKMPEFKAMAQKMIDDQTREITELEQAMNGNMKGMDHSNMNMPKSSGSSSNGMASMDHSKMNMPKNTGSNSKGMARMDHSKMNMAKNTGSSSKGMAGIDHSKMNMPSGDNNMKGMDHSKMNMPKGSASNKSMEGMNHSKMDMGSGKTNLASMPDMNHGNMDMKSGNTSGMQGMDHSNMSGMGNMPQGPLIDPSKPYDNNPAQEEKRVKQKN